RPPTVPTFRCVSGGFALTTDGNLIVLPCLEALPVDDKLDATDESILNHLMITRANVNFFKEDEEDVHPIGTFKEDEGMINAIRIGFGELVGKICTKHPQLKLAPLMDAFSVGVTLYSCDNVVTADCGLEEVNEITTASPQETSWTTGIFYRCSRGQNQSD